MADRSEERPRRQRPPRSPSPIHASVTDARRLLRLFRELVQVPLFRSMRVGVDRAQSARTLLNQLDQLQFDPQINDAQLEERLRALFATIAAWHRRRLIDTFRRALGRDITGYLGQAAVAGVLEEAIQANVALISTIPEHAHAGLARRLHKFLLVSPFDQAEVRKLLTEQYSVTNSRLTLIARDQTTKLIGQLTETRQQEAGIRSYIWLTSRDERVRPTHASKEGMRFFWASPPADTGHPGSDIQCRCVPAAYVPGVTQHRTP